MPNEMHIFEETYMNVPNKKTMLKIEHKRLCSIPTSKHFLMLQQNVIVA